MKDATAAGPSNNSAELDGASFGDGTDPNESLIKAIRADLLQPEPRLTLGSFHVMRGSSDRFANLAVPITNVSTSNLCFVELEDFRLKDAAGTVLLQPDIGPYIDGSVLAASAALWTETCLQPGETGWILDIESVDTIADLYGAIDSVEFRIAAEIFPSDAVPAPRLIPSAYDVAADGIVTVCFANVGTGPAEMTAQAYSVYVGLDDQGNPLDWDFLRARVQPIGLVQAGQPGSVSSEHASFFGGKGHRIRPFIEFDSPGIPEQLPSYASGRADAWRAWRGGRLERAAQKRRSSPNP